MAMIVPRQAPVRPRVFSPYSGEILLLEDAVRELVETADSGVVFIAGPAGSGKTTALAHLAAVFSDAKGVRFLDAVTPGSLPKQKGWSVCVSSAIAEETSLYYRLAPWRADEWIEYLLAVHRDRCASVMTRLSASADPDPLGGCPELWQIVLEHMANDETIRSPREAVERFLQGFFPVTPPRWQFQLWALGSLIQASFLLDIETELLKEENARPCFRMLRHRPLQLVLAANQIVADIRGDEPCEYFQRRFPRDLVLEAAQEALRTPGALDRLRTWFCERPERHAMTASVLHAADIGWVPESGTRPRLAGALLEGIALPNAVLSGVDFSGADLSYADLGRANLEDARAIKTDLRHACLRAASLVKLVANNADLEGADLTAANLGEAFFDGASFENADLSDADLQKSSLAASNLSGAILARANLKQATLTEANLEGAAFVEANLEAAILTATKLREADFTGARFYGARMNGCDLEEMELPGADFRKASLQDALLTGSVMPDALFDDACLHGAGLADIDWERASLRGADLRGVSFHLGSSRSGRIGSPLASEGSRTGFYTDDYNEQDFKAPEEIRKANLCFADLRGARIDDVDFYLVDLRHALFDPEHEAHLRRCGAILEARTR
jgi:uncharacterized protein YjbI with pentapeptide repeats